jgi:hypothetical protein
MQEQEQEQKQEHGKSKSKIYLESWIMARTKARASGRAKRMEEQ